MMTLCIVAVARAQELSPFGSEPPTFVALDGLAKETFINLPGGRSFDYLAPELHRLWHVQVATVPWTGTVPAAQSAPNDSEYKNYVGLTQKLIWELATVPSDRPVVVIAHSWGSVIGYEALLALEDQSAPYIRPILFITLGSPLENNFIDLLPGNRFQVLRPKNVHRLSNVTWFNFRTTVRDPFSGQDASDIISSCIVAADTPPTHQSNCADLAISVSPVMLAELLVARIGKLSPVMAPATVAARLAAGTAEGVALGKFYWSLHNAYFEDSRALQTIAFAISITARRLEATAREELVRNRISVPHVALNSGRPELVLTAAMKRALAAFDPSFVPFSGYDYPVQAGTTPVNEHQAPFAVVGDFNGDGIPDAVVDGYSGAGIKRIAIISRWGSYEASAVTDSLLATFGKGKPPGEAVSLNLLQTPRLWSYLPNDCPEVTLNTDAVGVTWYQSGRWAYYYVTPGDRFGASPGCVEPDAPGNVPIPKGRFRAFQLEDWSSWYPRSAASQSR